MDHPRGALIGALTPDGPAAKGGLKTSDVVLSFDGKPVPSMRDLPKIVALSPIGKTVKVEVLRGGERLTLDVTIERLVESGAEPASATPGDELGPEAGDSQSVLGLTLVPLTPELRRKYAIADTVNGVLVAGADPGGPAGQKGIREGEVVSEVTNEEVKTPAEVVKRIETVKSLGRASVLLLVTTPKGDIRFVAVPVK
jgi:serine protease Do